MAFLNLSKVSPVLASLAFLSLAGCQIPYLVQSGYNQVKLLAQRQPIDEVIEQPEVSSDIKNKLKLAQKVRAFAETRLGLQTSNNYTTYVQLDRPYVTYIVSAAPRTSLEPYLWWFPLVGHVPYKGYFHFKGAQSEAKGLEKKGLDTYVRGVSAYSTLGWFDDPLLSSMMSYPEHVLVDTIIHETVHTTIYIKSEAAFNERLATFLGQKGTEIFYKKTEGDNAPTLSKIKKESVDDHLFSQFISEISTEIDTYYKAHPDLSEAARQALFDKSIDKFRLKTLPRLQTEKYKSFGQEKLNNAKLIAYKTYYEDLTDFQRAYDKLDQDFSKMVSLCLSLEKEDSPQEALKSFIK